MQFGNVPMILKGCGFGGQGEGASLGVTLEYDNDKESFLESDFGKYILHKAPEIAALIQADKDTRTVSVGVSRFGGFDLHELTAHKCNANSRREGAEPHFTIAGATMSGAVKLKVEQKDTEDFTGDWIYVEIKFKLPCANSAALSVLQIGKMLKTELWMDSFVTNQAARPIVRSGAQGEGGAAADLFEGPTDEELDDDGDGAGSEPVPAKPGGVDAYGFDSPDGFDPEGEQLDNDGDEQPREWAPFTHEELLDLREVGSLEDYVNSLSVSQLQRQIREAYPGQTASSKDKSRLRTKLIHLVKPAPVDA